MSRATRDAEEETSLERERDPIAKLPMHFKAELIGLCGGLCFCIQPEAALIVTARVGDADRALIELNEAEPCWDLNKLRLSLPTENPVESIGPCREPDLGSA